MEQAAQMIPRELLKNLEPGFDDGQAPMTAQEYEQSKADLFNQSRGNLHEQDGYSCEKCKNKGYIAVVQYNEQFGYYSETLTACKCQRVRKAIHRLERSGLKDVVKKYTFDTYQTPDKWQEHIKQTAMRFCHDDQHNWFFIGGQSGAGKSHICTAIAVHYIKQGLDVRYMVWRDEIDRMKGMMMDQPEQYSRIMQELKETPVLYIDDLFKEGTDSKTGQTVKPSGADVRKAFEIINHRYNKNGLITIISSERTLSDLLTIDEAFAGRIAEYAKEGGYLINLKKDSSRNWRLKGIQEI